MTFDCSNGGSDILGRHMSEPNTENPFQSPLAKIAHDAEDVTEINLPITLRPSRADMVGCSLSGLFFLSCGIGSLMNTWDEYSASVGSIIFNLFFSGVLFLFAFLLFLQVKAKWVLDENSINVSQFRQRSFLWAEIVQWWVNPKSGLVKFRTHRGKDFEFNNAIPKANRGTVRGAFRLKLGPESDTPR